MAGQVELRIESLPESALEAAGVFHGEWLAEAQALLSGEQDALAVVLPSAPYDHDDWRRAAARDLARAHAPKRINVISGTQEAAISATLSYLAGAPGVTGQYLKAN